MEPRHGDPMTWAGDDAERPPSEKGSSSGEAHSAGTFVAGIKLRPTVPDVTRAADTAKIVGKASPVKPQKDDRLGTSVELPVTWPAARGEP